MRRIMLAPIHWDGRVISADVPKEIPEEKKASKIKDSSVSHLILPKHAF